MCEVVPPQVYETLKKVVKRNIDNFEITVHDPNKKGEGFLGEMVFVTLADKESHEVLDLVVKQAFTNPTIRDNNPIRHVFMNEIYFYTQVWTRLNTFQEKIPPQYQFRKLPKCFASFSEDNSERVVLENLKFQNFQVHDKQVPLSREHYELIFKEYGKFHALSFAYKALQPKAYAELTDGLLDLYSDFLGKEGFCTAIKEINEITIESLQPGTDDDVIEKFKPYLKDYIDLFRDSINCDTKYTVITHGDCWSNNMMFKYNDNKQVTDVRFLDFQLSKVGSPCCDLSYSLYSGAPEEVLKDFEHYLQVYHGSLSDTLREFGCDPEELYPLQALKNDWKQYCKLGVMMGLLIWKIKYTYEENLMDLTDSYDDEVRLEGFRTGYDKERFRKMTRNLLLHLYEHDFL